MALSPLSCTLNGNSTTELTVASFSDSTISFSSFTITDPYPVFAACRQILKLTAGKAKPYKLQVHVGSKLLFTVRSVYWGSRRTMDEMQPDYEITDRQFLTQQM